MEENVGELFKNTYRRNDPVLTINKTVLAVQIVKFGKLKAADE